MVILGHCITTRASVLDTVLRTPIDIVVILCTGKPKGKKPYPRVRRKLQTKNPISSRRVVYSPLVYLTMFEDTVKFGVRGS